MIPLSTILRDYLAKTMMITLYATCSIDYNGRAQSYLPSGERLIIIKPDKTLLIHQPAGNAPINYMKEGTHYHLAEHGNVLILTAHNLRAQEAMIIELHAIHHVYGQPLQDGAKIQLHGHEKDMSDMLYTHPALVEKGLKPVSREEKTEFGFIDVLCRDTKNNLVIIECKRNHADFKAVEQLQRYVEKVKKSKGIMNVRGILASPSISENAKTLLKQLGFQHAHIEPPKFKEAYKKNQKKIGEY